MISFDLAKELKEAGFPQNGESRWDILSDGTKHRNGHPWESRFEIAYIPTLSELIEACGEEFRDLCFHPEGFFEGDESKKWNTNRDSMWHCKLPPSASPEEAVARLWLALNKK